MQRGSATSPTTNEMVQESARLQPQASPPVGDAVGNADALCQLLKLIEQKQHDGAVVVTERLQALVALGSHRVAELRAGAGADEALLPELASLAADWTTDAHIRCAALRAMAETGLCSNAWLGAHASVQYADALSMAAGRPLLAAQPCISIPRHNGALVGGGEHVLVVMRNGRLTDAAAAVPPRKTLRACMQGELGISAQPMRRDGADAWDDRPFDHPDALDASVLRRCVRPSALLAQSPLLDPDAHDCLQASRPSALSTPRLHERVCASRADRTAAANTVYVHLEALHGRAWACAGHDMCAVAACNMRRTACNMQRTACNMQRTACNMRCTTCNAPLLWACAGHGRVRLRASAEWKLVRLHCCGASTQRNASLPIYHPGFGPRCCHTCPRTGLPPTTSAPGLGSPCHICSGTRLDPPALCSPGADVAACSSSLVTL